LVLAAVSAVLSAELEMGAPENEEPKVVEIGRVEEEVQQAMSSAPVIDRKIAYWGAPAPTPSAVGEDGGVRSETPAPTTPAPTYGTVANGAHNTGQMARDFKEGKCLRHSATMRESYNAAGQSLGFANYGTNEKMADFCKNRPQLHCNGLRRDWFCDSVDDAVSATATVECPKNDENGQPYPVHGKPTEGKCVQVLEKAQDDVSTGRCCRWDGATRQVDNGDGTFGPQLEYVKPETERCYFDPNDYACGAAEAPPDPLK
jgi:hypothetical protein